MLKKTIKYTDFNDVERTEDFYFNLSKAELAEMEMSTAGGYGEMLQRMISSQDMPSIIKALKQFILRSYGEKSPDGKHFMKSEEISEKFSQTGAYDQLFMECISNPEAAADFITGIIPKDLQEETKKQLNP